MVIKMTDIAKEIEKLKFHIRLLSETIDPSFNPIPALVIQLNWDDKNLDKAHDIFEKYDKQIEEKIDVSWHAFEHDLRDTFGIGYQTVKSIVLAFYRNHQWTEVCYQYAKEYECMEFHEITRSRG